MKEPEILLYLPKLYFMKGQKNKYEILKELNLSGRGRDYDKVKEMIDMGFLNKVSDNPPTFEVTSDHKNRIWNFFRQTPIGEEIMRIIEDRKLVFG
jgi:hypothetical protein